MTVGSICSTSGSQTLPHRSAVMSPHLSSSLTPFPSLIRSNFVIFFCLHLALSLISPLLLLPLSSSCLFLPQLLQCSSRGSTYTYTIYFDMYTMHAHLNSYRNAHAQTCRCIWKMCTCSDRMFQSSPLQNNCFKSGQRKVTAKASSPWETSLGR